MRVLQIDTINVVARSPYLALFSRLGAYRADVARRIARDRRDLRMLGARGLFRAVGGFSVAPPSCQERLGHWSMKHAARMRPRAQAPEMDAILARIREVGRRRQDRPISRGGEKRTGGWWGWKDEKRWLEALFALGELMIARRDNFQRVYDLRASACWRKMKIADASCLSLEAMRRAFVLGGVRALGVTQARWIADYFRIGRRIKDADLDCLRGTRRAVARRRRRLESTGYVHPDHRDACLAAARGRLRATHTTLLSPFDPVIWDRERVAAMFGFDYRIEVLRAGAQAHLRLLRAADPASRAAGWAARCEGASCRGAVRGEGAVSGGRRRDRRCAGRCDREGDRRVRRLARDAGGQSSDGARRARSSGCCRVQ